MKLVAPILLLSQRAEVQLKTQLLHSLLPHPELLILILQLYLIVPEVQQRALVASIPLSLILTEALASPLPLYLILQPVEALIIRQAPYMIQQEELLELLRVHLLLYLIRL